MSQIGILPYLRVKCELYSGTWFPEEEKQNVPRITIQDEEIPKGLDTQTRENFKTHWNRWYRILQSSTAPGVSRIKEKVKLLHPTMSNRDIAKHFGLLQCLLNNAAHGPTGISALSVFENPDTIVDALKKWHIKDPVLLDITKVFEEVTTGL